jgi:hypothetical protein
MRALATALISSAMALGAFGLAIAAPHQGHPREPRAALGGTSGVLQISNSREGQAVLTATAMRPGQTVTGGVRIGNAGDVAGRFSVRPADVRETRGPFGGLLSERLQLALYDVTRPEPVAIYSGTPAAFGSIDLGTFERGAQRDYVVAATLPDGGLPDTDFGGDNRFQGSTLSLGLEWRATASGGTGWTVTPPSAVAPPGTAPPASTGSDSLGRPRAGTCIKRRRLTLRVKAPGGARVLSATVKVNGKVKARVKRPTKRARVRLRRLPARRITVVVSVRASNGRSYTSSRSYNACKRTHATRKRRRR